MAARKKKTSRRSSKPAELIISKARTKAAVKKCNVGGEFYEALDKAVRGLIASFLTAFFVSTALAGGMLS